MSRKKTTEEFINEAIEIHGERFDYTKVVYINALTPVEIVCSEHGSFMMKPNKHVSSKQACPNCCHNKMKTLEEFVQEANIIHSNKYDYSLITEYRGREYKEFIICPQHGKFEQLIKNHISNKAGCPHCSNNKSKTTQTFIEKAQRIHGNRYDYSKVEYTKKGVHVTIICRKHGEFQQTPNNHYNSVIGCNACKLESTESGPVKDIALLLRNHQYVKEKKFPDCKNKRELPFDFYIEDLNLLIEYDGIQHYKPIEFWGGDSGFEMCQKNDAIKTNYCLENNINLLRIRYDEDHTSVLKEYFKNKFNIDIKE